MAKKFTSDEDAKSSVSTGNSPEVWRHEYVSIRFPTLERDWLFELAERETKTHKEACLCIGCNARRKLHA